jgi:hypothetical protein
VACGARPAPVVDFAKNPASVGKAVNRSSVRRAKGMVPSGQEMSFPKGSFRFCVSGESMGAVGPVGPPEVAGGWFNGAMGAVARGRPARDGCLWMSMQSA